MEITKVRVQLPDRRSTSQIVKAYCSIEFDDCLAVHELRLLEVDNRLFVAMPSRESRINCQKCGDKNNVSHRYCSSCGADMAPQKSHLKPNFLRTRHRDVVHPFTKEMRTEIESRVLEEYHRLVNSHASH